MLYSVRVTAANDLVAAEARRRVHGLARVSLVDHAEVSVHIHLPCKHSPGAPPPVKAHVLIQTASVNDAIHQLKKAIQTW